MGAVSRNAGVPTPSEQRLRSIVEQAAPLIFQTTPDGLIDFAAGYHLETLGLSSDDLLGTSFLEFVGGQALAQKAFQLAMVGEFSTTELPLAGCEFEVRLTPVVDQHGAIAGVTAIFLDITSRALAAAELRRSEASFRALIESSPDAIFVHRFGRIVYANDATRALLLYGCMDDLLGKPVLELFAKVDRPAVASSIRMAAINSEAYSSRHRLTRSDGDQGICEVTTMSLQYDGEDAIVHIVRDVTQALRMQTKLAQTERLASLGTLASGVGHEINNPLAYMTANLSFIADELKELLPPTSSEENADLHNALQDVRDGTDRVRDIVRQLGEFTKVDADTEDLIDPRSAVESAIRMSWNHLRRHARIETHLHLVGSVRGNQARLGQVLLALLLNATDAMVDNLIADSKLSVRCRNNDGEVLIEVEDNGPGISDEILTKIFDPFFSAGKDGQGTGLGLSVAHSIVAAMGGTLEVQTQLGAGTTIQVFLPKAHDSAGTVRGDKSVLVITDEVRFLEAAQIALRGETIRIAGRMSIAAADLHDTYDAILCDLSSADVDIATFAKDARAHSDLLLFVAQSGTSVSSEEEALASVLLRKPVGADRLAMQLAALWKSS